jgi:selenophosphate synthetase-related protein
MASFDVRWLRGVFLEFDKVSKPVMGIADWDDAACVGFGGKRLVLSCDGPYKKRLVMKSALIHAATDVIVKGAKPLVALDTLSGPERDVREMADSLRKQGLAMKIPIVGGNTNLEGEPQASIFVVGELLLEEPIRDSTAKRGDVLLLIGEPLWGEQKERFAKAKKLFACWFKVIESCKINAAKDVTKGGLALTASEIAEKSGLKAELFDIKIHKYRNLDNFLVAVDKRNAEKVKSICKKMKCPCIEAGVLK